MDGRDILDGDVRVTVLAEEGMYSFDWKDKDKKEIKFLEDESGPNTVSDEVITLLESNGYNITNVDSNSVTNNTKTENSNEILSPVEQTSETGLEEYNLEFTEELDNESNHEEEDKLTNNSGEDNYTEVSYMIRMNEVESRENAIKEKLDENQNVKKLQLSGPYSITYRVHEDDIELIKLEDLGLGCEIFKKKD